MQISNTINTFFLPFERYLCHPQSTEFRKKKEIILDGGFCLFFSLLHCSWLLSPPPKIEFRIQYGITKINLYRMSKESNERKGVTNFEPLVNNVEPN